MSISGAIAEPQAAKPRIPVRDAVNRSGIGRSKLYELLRTGQIAGVRFGRRVKVDVDSLDEFVRQHPAATVADESAA